MSMVDVKVSKSKVKIKFKLGASKIYRLRAKGRAALAEISKMESEGFDVPKSVKNLAKRASEWDKSIYTEKQVASYKKMMSKLNVSTLKQRAKLTVESNGEIYKANMSYKDFEEQGEALVDKKLAYYTKLEQRIETKMNEIRDDKLSAAKERNRAAGLTITLKDIRKSEEFNDWLGDNSDKTDIFDDDNDYRTKDFRDLMLEHGISRSIISSLSVKLGYGTLDDYENSLDDADEDDEELDFGEEYDSLASQYIAASNKRRGLEELKSTM